MRWLNGFDVQTASIYINGLMNCGGVNAL